MRNYPRSKSPAAAPAAWTAYVAGRAVRHGKTMLSTTSPRRALRRLIAHVEREFPEAGFIAAEFCPPSEGGDA